MITLVDRKNGSSAAVDEAEFFNLKTAMVATFYMLPWKGLKWPDRELVFECADAAAAEKLRAIVPLLDRPFRGIPVEVAA